MVKKIFVDTNVWLRFLLIDIKDQYIKSKELIELFEEGKLRPYISTIVLLEVNFVLTSFYKLSKKEAFSVLEEILETRNVTLIEKTNFKKASKYYKKYNIKLSDCLVVSSVSENCVFCTWDEELKKIKGIKVLTPKEIVSSLKTIP